MSPAPTDKLASGPEIFFDGFLCGIWCMFFTIVGAMISGDFMPGGLVALVICSSAGPTVVVVLERRMIHSFFRAWLVGLGFGVGLAGVPLLVEAASQAVGKDVIGHLSLRFPVGDGVVALALIVLVFCGVVAVGAWGVIMHTSGRIHSA